MVIPAPACQIKLPTGKPGRTGNRSSSPSPNSSSLSDAGDCLELVGVGLGEDGPASADTAPMIAMLQRYKTTFSSFGHPSSGNFGSEIGSRVGRVLTKPARVPSSCSATP